MTDHRTRDDVLTTGYQREVAAWWDNGWQDRVNLALGETAQADALLDGDRAASPPEGDAARSGLRKSQLAVS